MLWTIMDESTVMEGTDKIKNAEKYIYAGRPILGCPVENGKVQIIQLLTSNPADFLDPRFTPGKTVYAKKM